MKFATASLLSVLCVFTVRAQSTEFDLQVPLSDVFEDPYSNGIHSSARDVSGPYDLDGDGLYEFIVADYSGGGRIHVVENTAPDTWELVYTTPWADSSASTNESRAVAGASASADLDGDGKGEIVILTGTRWSATNAKYPAGLHVYEWTGIDNDYGDAPAAVYSFDTAGGLPDRFRAEGIETFDVDGDGRVEIYFGNDTSSSDFDDFHVLSLEAGSDIGSGFEVWVSEMRLNLRSGKAHDPVDRGGGSPYGMLVADFNGDGIWEVQMSAWNCVNLSNASVPDHDTYIAPNEGDPNISVYAADTGNTGVCGGDVPDNVALFGGVATDINGDGEDEAFYPVLQTGDVTVVNYEAGEDVLQITRDQVHYDLIESFSGLGITAGDVDGDGQPELIGSGPSFTGGSFDAGNSPTWIRVAKFIGAFGKSAAGDPEDAANYVVTAVEFPEDADEGQFDTTSYDSLGAIVRVEHSDDTDQGPVFTSKLAYLGDPDMDGNFEVAVAFQGVDDSLTHSVMVWNADSLKYFADAARETKSANPKRVFGKVIEFTPGGGVAIDEERMVLPSDYVLHDAYPNPFNPTTTIRFELPVDKAISLEVYDISGRLVRRLVDNQQYSQGAHEVVWDATDAAGIQVASGTYIYSLRYGNFRQSRKVVLLK